jgi:sirohydrochlorin ferrochelatase
MKNISIFFVTHGSSDRRSWLALQNLLTVARSQNLSDLSNLSIGDISGGCLEGQALSLAQQLEKFANQVIASGGTEIAIMPLFLLEGVHVSEDIPAEVAIAQSKFINKLLFRTIAHLGTSPQIPDLIFQQFEKYSDRNTTVQEQPSRILVSHGSRRAIANHVVEGLAHHSQAITAYWGVEPKIEIQIDDLLSQGINKINVLPYFLTEGGITEAIANKLKPYGDRAQIQLLSVPLSDEQIIQMSLDLI